MQTEEKIKSIGNTMGATYRKPEISKLEQHEQALESSNEAKEYLLKRGISDTTIKNFRLGYDSNKHAITIPVFKDGELINLRYRFIEPDKQKYTQERGCEIWLYNDDGIQKAIDKKWLLVVEGEFDLMMCWQAGIYNVVSPASGKDSYAPWLELLDVIPKVILAFDNDEPGKKTAQEFAERVGIDKCYEITYPKDIKDANDYFLEYTLEDFKKLYKESKPFYKYKFQGLGEIIESLRSEQEITTELEMLPGVEFEDDWLAIISGDSNVGKTSYVLNIAKELTNKNIPTLVLPFERGIKSVGTRFLQVYQDKTRDDFLFMEPSDWDKLRDDTINLPLYFSMPTLQEVHDIIQKAKRLFGIKFIIVDHLDYFIRGADKVSKQADMVHKMKTWAQDNQIVFLVVHHINKPDKTGLNKRPTKEDLKGSSDIYQIAECVALLHKPVENYIEVIVDKNKGKMGTYNYTTNMDTGLFKKVDQSVIDNDNLDGDDWWK